MGESRHRSEAIKMGITRYGVMWRGFRPMVLLPITVVMGGQLMSAILLQMFIISHLKDMKSSDSVPCRHSLPALNLSSTLLPSDLSRTQFPQALLYSVVFAGVHRLPK